MGGIIVLTAGDDAMNRRSNTFALLLTYCLSEPLVSEEDKDDRIWKT